LRLTYVYSALCTISTHHVIVYLNFKELDKGFS
jgi:hypothetical protein